MSVVACSSDAPNPMQAAGAPSSAGATATGGAANPSAGAPAGGAPTQAGASSGGSQSAGSSQGGAGSGGSAAGGGGASGGGLNGGSGGAGGSAGSSAGAAGSSAGGSARPEAELDGAGWTMKCNFVDTDPQAMNRCYLLPPGAKSAADCPSAGYTSVDQTLHFGGTPGTHYQVTIHFKGTHEAGDYTGGTADPKEFLRGATHISGGLHTWLSMEVSSPAATYNPNSGGGAGSVQVYDYSATIPIDGGATIRLKAYDKDCLMHRYCQNDDYKNCKGLVQPPFSPADAPIDGSFLQMAVTSVVVK